MHTVFSECMNNKPRGFVFLKDNWVKNASKVPRKVMRRIRISLLETGQTGPGIEYTLTEHMNEGKGWLE